MVIGMEWKVNSLSRTEMERKQAEYIKKAMDMAKKSQSISEVKKEVQMPLKKVEPVKEPPVAEPALPKQEPLNAGKSFIITSEKSVPPVAVEPPPVVVESPPKAVVPTPAAVEPSPKAIVPPPVAIIPPPAAVAPPPKAVVPTPAAVIPPPVPVAPPPAAVIPKAIEIEPETVQRPVTEKTIIEAEVEIGFTGILTEQELNFINPEDNIPEKIRNYNNDETSYSAFDNVNNDECDMKEIKRNSCPPNFINYINEHNKQFSDDNNQRHMGNENIHGRKQGENNCPQCNSSKKNWI